MLRSKFQEYMKEYH